MIPVGDEENGQSAQCLPIFHPLHPFFLLPYIFRVLASNSIFFKLDYSRIQGFLPQSSSFAQLDTMLLHIGKTPRCAYIESTAMQNLADNLIYILIKNIKS